MTIISKAAVGIAVGIAGIFVGYCFYFDQKRRSDPDFKKKLRERRKAKKRTQKVDSKTPDLKDREVVQRFFVQEVQLGEELLASGEVESGVLHLANAVSVCGQPTQLMNVLEKTLPPTVFQLLVRRLPFVSLNVSTQMAMGEEDIE